MYGPVPPAGVAVAEPLSAEQVAAVMVMAMVSKGGCVMVMVAVETHPL